MKTLFSIQPMSFGTLARMCQGELYQGSLGEVSVMGICTDSREAGPQVAFAALRGERVDGHNYIAQALENGCRCIICEHRNEQIAASQATAIVVKDTELALSKLAYAYRLQNLRRVRTVAVTGSVGKTTTKDMIHAAFSVAKRTYKTPGNHNSLIGMPLSVLETPVDSEWTVLEMGMSGFGEIERLSILAEPDIAVITNIGSSHLEMLGSRENICRAKLEILCGLREGGYLILNGDEPLLRKIGGKSYHTVYVSLADEKADFFANNIRVEQDCTRFDAVCQGRKMRDLCIRVLGRHHVYAALYTLAAATIIGMSEAQIREGLLRFAPEGMRQRVCQMSGITVIEDCYNASPESMIAAIDVLDAYSRQSERRSVAVLGDMLELGQESPALHRSVGAHLAARGIDLLFTVGSNANQIAIGARQKGMSSSHMHRNMDVQDLEKTADLLVQNLRRGDIVLFKASRSVGAERIVELLRERMAGRDFAG
ncbi:MAG: UDP-N-acetylmuramoyl-tripeptide--D-alanyl-D-alanine ligase [Clostridia bacterium]|nr:UDP-N-acetylmuramoyl-tripeptide--D-alanyl-D-alanine ligase [Clostridia bacterium]